jgi:hypothetical protein
MSSQDEAIKLVTAWQRQAGPSLWHWMDRKELAQGLIDRIKNPNLINQSQYGLCVTAAFVRSLVADDPVGYAQLAIDLYETGKGFLRKWVCPLTASPSLRAFYYGKKIIHPADWIILVTLRDNLNPARNPVPMHYDPKLYPAGAGVEDILQWFHAAGYLEIETKSLYAPTVSTLNHLNHLLTTNYRVMLDFNADLLDPTKQTVFQPPNAILNRHAADLLSWIICYGDPNHPSTRISFKLFTWGRAVDVGEGGVLTIAHFFNKLYGYLAAKY